MKRLLILLVVVIIGVCGKQVQTKSELKTSIQMEHITNNKMEELAKSMDATLVDKHPEHEVMYKNMFVSSDLQKIEELAKSMNVTLVDKHPEIVHETFKNMFTEN